MATVTNATLFAALQQVHAQTTSVSTAVLAQAADFAQLKRDIAELRADFVTLSKPTAQPTVQQPVAQTGGNGNGRPQSLRLPWYVDFPAYNSLRSTVTWSGELADTGRSLGTRLKRERAATIYEAHLYKVWLARVGIDKARQFWRAFDTGTYVPEVNSDEFPGSSMSAGDFESDDAPI